MILNSVDPELQGDSILMAGEPASSTAHAETTAWLEAANQLSTVLLHHTAALSSCSFQHTALCLKHSDCMVHVAH